MSVDGQLNPYRDETDEAILEVFSRADDEVLLTKEIWPELSIGKKQTRRRLRDLESRGVLASRETTQDIIWWLDAEVEEPITVKYPLLRFVRRRFDVQALLLGVGLGFLGGLLVLLYVTALAYETRLALIARQDLLTAGMYTTVIGAGAVVGGLSSLIIQVLRDRFGPVP